MSEASTALAESAPKNPAKHLKPYRFRPGTSPNPGGRPKGTTLVELKAVARANFPLAVERLAALMQSQDERIALEAVQFVYLYALGKPQEGRDVAHLESIQARHQEVVAVPMEQIASESESPLPIPEPAPVHEPVQVSASPTSSVPPEAPRESSGVSREPSGLRCLYRGKEGQCEEMAPEGSQWCQPHRTKLFSALEKT